MERFICLRRFHSIYYINKAIGIWSKGDTLISSLVDIGQDLHTEMVSVSSSQDRINMILSRLDPLNDKLTKVEDDFSYTLGEGSRWLEYLILKLLLGLVLTVEISGLSLTIFVSRGISRGLNEIISSSEKIAGGDLTTRAKIYSRDEIGILAGHSMDMTGQLQAEHRCAETVGRKPQRPPRSLRSNRLWSKRELPREHEP